MHCEECCFKEVGIANGWCSVYFSKPKFDCTKGKTIIKPVLQ